MRDELQRYLDGDLAVDHLPAELRGEAAAWDALLVDVREAGAPEAPVGLETLVMTVVRLPVRPAWQKAMLWWWQPRNLQVSPLAGLALAAVLALVVTLPNRPGEPEMVTGSGPEAVREVYVQFLLQAPSASSVSLAGDFTDWLPAEVTLADHDGDGTWTVRIPLEPGVYEYMFVIDGERWVTDPHAERYEDDGYGNRNAVLAIGASGI